jgi:hypothetical protein
LILIVKTRKLRPKQIQEFAQGLRASKREERFKLSTLQCLMVPLFLASHGSQPLGLPDGITMIRQHDFTSSDSQILALSAALIRLLVPLTVSKLPFSLNEQS